MDAFGEVDPAADFLAREQSDLAGLEDDLKPVTSAPTSFDGFEPSFEHQNGLSPPNDDFEVVNDEENSAFPSDCADILISNEPIDGFGYMEEFPAPEEPAMPSVSPVVAAVPKPTPVSIQIKPPREEPEKIRIWREEQKKRLEEKDLEEAKKIEEWREAAKKELDDWYRHHEELVAKTKAANRNAEKEQVAAEDEIVPGTEWERIAKLCDFNPKASKGSKDVSRMRSIILQLKQTPLQRKS